LALPSEKYIYINNKKEKKTKREEEVLTGKKDDKARSNRFCWANRPLSKYTRSHLWSGYFMASSVASCVLLTSLGSPTSLSSVEATEYQSSG